jgi:hypothetical protein
MPDGDRFALLSLNPGHETAPRNPLCPVCHDEIRPISNDAERRFVCGCEQVWEFTFERQADTAPTAGDEAPVGVDYELVKAAESRKWHWYNPSTDECFCGNVKSFAIDARAPPNTPIRREVSGACLDAFRQTTTFWEEQDG